MTVRISAYDVELRTPQPEELPALVRLRNRERRWFGDRSELPVEEGSTWIASRDQEDSLNCIVHAGIVIGTIGWTKVPERAACYEIGRLIADYSAARSAGMDANVIRAKLRVGSWLALDFLFTALNASAIYARIRPENGLIRNMIHEFGLEPALWPAPDAPEAPALECWAIDALRWRQLRNKILAHMVI
jgi:hypothetical protein